MRLVQSRTLADYATLIAELTPALGARFGESIANWCGVGERPYPLAYWDVWVVEVVARRAGVASLYRRPEDPPERCWIGWFGLLAAVRGRGYAHAVLGLLEAEARAHAATELRVYTDLDNSRAIRAYTRAGFRAAAVVDSTSTGRAADPTGLVLTKAW